jgi:DNA polymerase kappa
MIWMTVHSHSHQFFQPPQDQVGRKRPKLELKSTSDEVIEIDEEVWEDAMPGYHEDHEDDVSVRDEEDPSSGPSSNTDRPPNSAPAGSQITPQESSNTGKPKSTAAISLEKAQNPGELTIYDCPICERSLQTDNDGFNAHIDFCLSRGAIREAQSEASRTPAKSIRPASTSDGHHKSRGSAKGKKR